MQFSKLDDTEFPNLATASPYALKNTFDYTRWVPGTKIHLVNVLWNADYSNVVKFSNDTARDAWFNSISDSYVLELTSNARMVPDGTVKVPLPYDVAARYNYLFVDIPLATSQEQMIQNETTTGVRRWFFFIGDVDYSAPNTTILYLQLDVWTNFIDSARIQYMMLERGHAPVSASDTDSYLANPISNNKYLLAPDVNFDDTSVVRNSKYIPFGNGTKYICIASVVSPSAISNGTIGSATGSGTPTFSDPTFSDTADWYGYQLQVNGYEFSNGRNYEATTLPVGYSRANSDVPTSLYVYAIAASDQTFLQDMHNTYPTFLRSIKALFLVDEQMINRGAGIALGNHTLYPCTGTENSFDYKLTKSMFGFDSNESRFAKLYTYPYSRLEVSDNDGNVVEVRIENTGNSIAAHMLTSVAFPVLNFRVFLSGINGIGSQNYTWKNLNGTELNKSVPNGDWDRLMFELDIPTFGLYMDSETAWMLDNYSGMQNAREQALVAYHNSVRSANDVYTTVRATAATNNTNEVDSANTALTNSNATSTTNKTNTNNAAKCVRDNIDIVVANNTANTNVANNISTNITQTQNGNTELTTAQANVVTTYSTTKENDVSITTTQNTGKGSIDAGILSGAQSAAGGPLSTAASILIGGVVGGVSAGISAYYANQNANLMANVSRDLSNLNIEANNRVLALNEQANSTTTTYTNSGRTQETDNNNSSLVAQGNNNKSTSDTNAQNLYNTNTANAGRTNSTSVGNSNRTLGTNNDNASKDREVSILNAQETLRAAKDTQQNRWRDYRRGNPIELCPNTGDAANMYYGQNGIQFRLRTQSDSAIAQTAAQFARFGYNLNQLWNVADTGLNLMKNFTYWKASDIWVDVKNAATSEVGDTIARIFTDGTTVWSDPSKIGKVSIYDN